MQFIRSLVLLLGLSILGAGSGVAQDYGPATDYARWTVQAEPQQVRQGEAFRLRFDLKLESGWKMYAMDSPLPSRGIEIEFDSVPVGVTQVGDVRQSEPSEGFDPNFGINVRYFEHSATIEADFAVAVDAPTGRKRVTGKTTFMICTDVICLPPTPVPFEARVEVRQAAAGGAQSVVPDLTDGRPATSPERAGDEIAARPEVASNEMDDARAGGLWAFLLLAAGAGLAALLTPCVFPMIPLTVSYFTKHADDRRTSIRMAAVYGLSIVVTFTLLGVLAAIFVGAAGAQTIAANPWINLFIGFIFIVFALSLLGLFELRLPNGLLNYFNRQSSEKGGYAGVLFMGLTLTLVSFSCTAPFVGGLLAATVRDEWAYPVLGMLVFSATFSLPFILFALFPRGLSALPRSGSWMNSVKVVLGFVELAAAIKFLSNADLIWGWGLISRPLAIALVSVIFFLAGLYLIGKLPLKHESPGAQVGVMQLLVAIAFFASSIYLLPGLFGAPLHAIDAYLPPRMATDMSLVSAFNSGERRGGRDDFAWHSDIDAAFDEARLVNKPVFIDFTGYTCTNCRQMEANVFPKPQVAERLERDYVLLRLYTDDAEVGPDLQRYQLRLTGTVALPTYAIVHPQGEKLLVRHSGIATVTVFAAFLDRGTSTYAQGRLAMR